MSVESLTEVELHDDGTFIRTALVLRVGDDKSSVALVDAFGNRIALVNFFYYGDDHLIVDVIDVDDQYDNKAALTFLDGQHNAIGAGHLVSADFRKGDKNGH